ncbi:Uncharacterised protein [uncultured archaeon]|nr:Uncharacterised protein [uncultured archaeon]
MSRIAKKSRTVKGGKKPKTSRTAPVKAKKKPSPTRYTIRKDSLDRRYAIDKRTGKRVSVAKADIERAKRKKAAAKATPVFRGIKPLKAPKPVSAKTRRQKRSQAAKKGWETRRQRAIIEQPPISERSLKRLGEEVGAYAIPAGLRMHIMGGIADRAEDYPKVKDAADQAFAKIQVDFYSRRVAMLEDRPLPEPTATPKFDKHHGVGMGQLIRDRLALARDLSDIDQMIEEMAEDPEYDATARELYTLYFSPEVA